MSISAINSILIAAQTFENNLHIDSTSTQVDRESAAFVLFSCVVLLALGGIDCEVGSQGEGNGRWFS